MQQRTCSGCGNVLTITEGTNHTATTLVSDVQRSATCPWCGSPLFGQPAAPAIPAAQLSQVAVYRWFTSLPPQEQRQVFEDLARLQAWIVTGGCA